MKKRLLSFLMCALIVVSSFIMAACSDDEGELEKLGGESDELTSTSNNEEMTICIYSIRGEGTTDEAIELVEQALTRIAYRKFKTKIDLILIDEKDYAPMMFTKIRTAMAAYNTALIKDIASLTDEEIAKIKNDVVDYKDDGGNYYIKENSGVTSEVNNGTLDIFLCYTPVNDLGERDNSLLYSQSVPKDRQFSMFDILYKEKALAPLKSNLDGLYSDLNNVLYTHALEYVTRPVYDNNGGTDYYGIPNNYVYGSYDYLIFNEEYVNDIISPNGNGIDKSDYIPVDGKSTARFNTLISELRAAKAAGKIGDNVLVPAGDGDTVQVFDSYESFESFVNGGGYDFDGDGTISDAELAYNDFTIARISGSSAVGELLNADTFEKFDVYVEKYNKVTNSAEFCDSMYCIGRNAMGADLSGARVKRCLDILKLINTNKEFRNILQYGVEGVHYSQYSEDEDVNPLNGAKPEDKYTNLNPMYFGNMFLLYSNSDMTAAEKLMAKNNWQMAKDQIIELVPWVTNPDPKA